jgi:hypothetical protein
MSADAAAHPLSGCSCQGLQQLPRSEAVKMEIIRHL